VQEAVLEALDHWPNEGIPEKPGAWLMTTARRKGLDRLRREARYREKLVELEESTMGNPIDDDRLRLIFTCCHPALSREAQLALTLRSVIGFTTAEIARAFLTSEGTVAQRIVRAKRKIVEANIPFKIPGPEQLDERLAEVLAVLYLTFNEGYLATAGPAGERRDLAEDAEWLAALLVRLMPDEPEALGLLALMRLHLARSRARFDHDGRMVLLKDQDRSLWDRGKIAGAVILLQRADRANRPGPYQLQAAIAASHAQAASWETTNWVQILGLYEGLACLSPSPVVRLNRAIALSHVAGPQAALAEVDELASDLRGYYLFHATRAELLRKLGRFEDARSADCEALKLTNNPAERELLQGRLNS
jgi:RNA polymerase sigma-70 factor (ECF subfamily)